MVWNLGPEALQKAISPLFLPAWRFYPQVDSTNDAALAWAWAGAPDGALVVAGEQTRGRGRRGRRWWSHPEAGLAFTIVARPLDGEEKAAARFTAWGAVALVEVLTALGVDAAVKWPNDVLLNGRKVAGVLAEAVWRGERLEAVVVGVGVNLAPQAVPPPEAVDFPAASVADGLGHAPARWDFLARVLTRLAWWRPRLRSEAFLRAWEARLAYRGQQVQAGEAQGMLLGLEADGGLRLQKGGAVQVIYALTGHLRPLS